MAKLSQSGAPQLPSYPMVDFKSLLGTPLSILGFRDGMRTVTDQNGTREFYSQTWLVIPSGTHRMVETYGRGMNPTYTVKSYFTHKVMEVEGETYWRHPGNGTLELVIYQEDGGRYSMEDAPDYADFSLDNGEATPTVTAATATGNTTQDDIPF